MHKMDTGRFLMMIGLIGLAVCLASAQTYATETPSAKGGVEPTSNQAQPVSSFLYNHGGNVALQNEAGSIYTRPDGRKVLVGAGGQTIVTDGDDSDEDTSLDGDDGGHNNVVINARHVGGDRIYSNGGGSVIMNSGGQGGYQTFNNHQIRIIDGGLQLTTGGKVYNFPAKEASVSSQEKIDINGQQATVEYENGNIIVELADGTVLAKADGGLFSGNRQSYTNRKQIQEDAVRGAARLQKQLSEQLDSQMRKLQEDLERTLGNIRF